MRFRTAVVAALLAAFAVFCVVQDRVTAEGARQYVALQKAAWEGQGEPVTIDTIVEPAVRRSVRVALMWSGVVLLLGIAAAGVLTRRTNRP